MNNNATKYETEFYTTSDIMNILHIKKTTVYKLLHAELFPYLHLNKSYLIKKDEFNKWLEYGMKKGIVF